MSRKYSDPPVIEAVCEFRLTPDSKWDLTIPGLIYEKLHEEFPHKEQRLVQEMQIIQSARGIQQQIHPPNERIQFLTEDRKTFVQVGPHLLAVNCLKPYPTWDRFQPRIERAFNALTEVVDIKGLQRIGLRYVNLIEIVGQTVELSDYFEFRPFLGQELPQNMEDFIFGCIFPFADGRDSCRVLLTAAVPEKPTSNAFILDLDYFLAQPQAISVDQALSWVEQAHQRIEELFEECITEQLRESFQEEK